MYSSFPKETIIDLNVWGMDMAKENEDRAGGMKCVQEFHKTSIVGKPKLCQKEA